MKGIILAGGKATRLYPVTKGVCKQLLPIYDKPLIYYPLSALMLAGIRDTLIISTEKDIPRFKDLLGSGKDIGMNFAYAVQKEPKGIAQSFIIAEDFIAGDPVCLILGDNLFYGDSLTEILKQGAGLKDGALVFSYYVNDPCRYGVIEFDGERRVIAIEEKPQKPKSNWAVTGIYFCDNKVVEIAKKLQPSGRGELEVTDVINVYAKLKELKVVLLGRGYAWLDTGTHDSFIDASMFIKTIEDRQGLKIGCIEEIAYRMGYIDAGALLRIAEAIGSSYGAYLKRIADEKEDYYRSPHGD
jgi:glucose-1-phosphate thymidylyltransferase